MIPPEAYSCNMYVSRSSVQSRVIGHCHAAVAALMMDTYVLPPCLRPSFQGVGVKGLPDHSLFSISSFSP